VLFYASAARQFGVEEALLLSIYHDAMPRTGESLVLGRKQWLALADFWNEEKLAQLTSSLVNQQAIDASFQSEGNIVISLTTEQASLAAEITDAPTEDLPIQTAPVRPTSKRVRPPVSRLPVVDSPPKRPLTRQMRRPAPETLKPVDELPVVPAVDDSPRGPAPTFGGSTGWHQNRSRSELHMQFQEIEKRNQRLKPMELGWRPTDAFFGMLPRHGISEEFAESLMDEFVLYWLDKDRKETNWDQKFLAWVKREFVKKQTREAREQRQDTQWKSGVANENTRTDTREKRKQVTAAIMDIRDTDW